MVARAIITLLALAIAASSSVARAEKYQFKVEYSKQEIFQGEAVNANFVLIGDEGAVDVEVARFPEFRGFWSENIALRQGPIPMMADFPSRLFRSALIGTYRIIPMTARTQFVLNPMKIVVKSFMDPGDQSKPVVLECQTNPLKINPLPALPQEIPKELYRGAVGTLSFRTESAQVFFQKDEPTQIRFTVQGDGNFQEINEIPLTLPPEVEVLSKRAYQSGNAQMMSKVFEITVVPHTAKTFLLPEVKFVWFDPYAKRYQVRALDPITFTLEPKPPGDPTFDLEGIYLQPEGTVWNPYHRLSKNRWLWIVQFLGVASLFGVAFAEKRRRRLWIESQTPKVRWRTHLEEVRTLFGQNQWDEMLGRADELAFSWLKELAALPLPVVRRSQALEMARDRVSTETIAWCEKIFEAREHYAYRGLRPPPAPTEDVMKSLESLYSQVA